MATEVLLFDDVVKEAPDDTTGIVSGKPFKLFDSGSIDNSTDNKAAVLIHINYKDITPDANDKKFKLWAVLQTRGATGWPWRVCAYQFTPYKHSNQAEERQIILMPGLINVFFGSDEVMAPGTPEKPKVLISRHMGKLSKYYKLVIRLRDDDPGGDDGFESVKVHATAETF